MKESLPTLSWDLGNTGKVFAKIYNVFYCTKKTEQPTGAVAEEAGQLKEQWFGALKSGDATRVQELISEGKIDVNITDQHGWSGLHLAAWNNYSAICEILLSHHCEINLPGPHNSCPLTLAAQRGHTDVVRLLLAAKCDVQCTAVLGENMDVTPLHLAAQNGHKEIVHLLVMAGATVNAQMIVRGIQGVTPLHLAVEAGHLDVMDVLIEHGCDVQSSTKAGQETAC